MSHYVISGPLLLVSLVTDSALPDMEIGTFVIAGSTVGKSGMLSLLLSCTTVLGCCCSLIKKLVYLGLGWLNLFYANEVVAGTTVPGGGGRGKLHLSLHCHHENDSCIKMGSG